MKGDNWCRTSPALVLSTLFVCRAVIQSATWRCARNTPAKEWQSAAKTTAAPSVKVSQHHYIKHCPAQKLQDQRWFFHRIFAGTSSPRDRNKSVWGNEQRRHGRRFRSLHWSRRRRKTRWKIRFVAQEIWLIERSTVLYYPLLLSPFSPAPVKTHRAVRIQ